MADEKAALTAKVVAAYLRNNHVAVSDVAELIRGTYAALVGVTVPIAGPTEQPQPFVSIKKSVTPDAIICLECGKSQKMLKRHLHTAHGLSVDEYRAKWSLPADYPMVAANYAARRSQLAIDSGLGRKQTVETTNDIEQPKTTGKPPNKYPPSRWAKPSV
jgi:predicted transcriptional regulator